MMKERVFILLLALLLLTACDFGGADGTTASSQQMGSAWSERTGSHGFQVHAGDHQAEHEYDYGSRRAGAPDLHLQFEVR